MPGGSWLLFQSLAGSAAPSGPLDTPAKRASALIDLCGMPFPAASLDSAGRGWSLGFYVGVGVASAEPPVVYCHGGSVALRYTYGGSVALRYTYGGSASLKYTYGGSVERCGED